MWIKHQPMLMLMTLLQPTLLLTRPEASNQCYLADTFDWQQVSESIHKHFPGQTKTPVGTPGKYPEHQRFDSSKAKKDLGQTFRSTEETFNNAVSQYLSWK